jgi:hypothetical protein
MSPSSHPINQLPMPSSKWMMPAGWHHLSFMQASFKQLIFEILLSSCLLVGVGFICEENLNVVCTNDLIRITWPYCADVWIGLIIYHESLPLKFGTFDLSAQTIAGIICGELVLQAKTFEETKVKEKLPGEEILYYSLIGSVKLILWRMFIKLVSVSILRAIGHYEEYQELAKEMEKKRRENEITFWMKVVK